MESKKNPRADFQKRQPLFLQLGLIAALSFVLFAFELRTPDQLPPQLVTGKAQTQIDETIINTTREVPKPPQNMPVPLTRLEILPDDTEAPFDSDVIIWSTDWELLPEYVPPLPPREICDLGDDEPILIPEVKAQFKGGEEAMYRWISENLRYPRDALQGHIQGVIYVQFVVEADGTIDRVGIAQGNLGGGLEEAATSLIKSMPNWEPAKQRNRPVSSWFVLPINFVIR